MKNRFVLGIVVVLSLQICFQVLMAFQRLDERNLRARTSTAVSTPIDTSPLEVAEVPESNEDGGSVAVTPRLRSAARNTTTVRPQFASLNIGRRPLFATVLITYPDVHVAARPKTPILPKVVTVAAKTENPQKPEPKAKNDSSLFARAVPVLKKPFEFLKLVGSKLK